MASCFKLSCCIYWLGLFFYLSYVISIEFFVGKFVVYTAYVAKTEIIIIILCLFNAFYSIIGSIYVKCNIIHPAYGICYVAPMMMLNFVGTILGLLATREAKGQFPSFETYRDNYASPSSLTFIERNSECCGYYGFWDHAAFLSITTHNKGSKRMIDFIPDSCCKSKNDTLCTQFLDINDSNNSAGMSIRELALNSSCDFSPTRASELSNYYIDSSSPKFYLNKSLSQMINACGCHRAMGIAHAAVYDSAHFIFFIMNVAIVSTMITVFVRNWYGNRDQTGTSSHSLDQARHSNTSLDTLRDGNRKTGPEKNAESTVTMESNRAEKY